MVKYLKLILFAAFLSPFISEPVSAQFYPTSYRPAGLDWQYIKTPHFRIVYPAGYYSSAIQTARILENEYADVASLLGSELKDFPIILNSYNDVSNGFVSTLHFRSELILSPIKGKAMNPKTGDWLETVAPHELVHAFHFAHLEGPFANIVKLLSPDAARSIHGAVPLGIPEGIATYHESEGVLPGGGRGNYPFFNNQFNSVFNSNERWSLGQMLADPADTRPFDRHYQGGVDFTDWLHDEYGKDFTRDAIDFYIRWPFLGYGVAMKTVSGQWPGQLYDQFVQDKEEELASRPKNRIYDPLDIPFDGADIRRPKWISQNVLVMFGSFYNGRPGFYLYHLEDHSFKLLAETFMVSDFIYDLSEDQSKIIFSSFRPNMIYDEAFEADLFSVDVKNGNINRITANERVYAPVFYRDKILALQSDQSSNKIVSVTDDSVISNYSVSDTKIVQIDPNPVDENQLAIIANRRGLQGLWIVMENELASYYQQLPDISFTAGSVFDLDWHPNGSKLLFSSDHTGIMQLYEYKLNDNALHQITESTYNAMEGSYSPDGNRISFIVQQGNQRLPAIIEENDSINRTVSDSAWKPGPQKDILISRAQLGADISPEEAGWEYGSYSSSFSWLKPRALVPVIEDFSDSETELGVGLHSNDLLQRNAYSLEFTRVAGRFWYDLDYRHTGFFPGFETSVFSNPVSNFLQLEIPGNDPVTRRFIRQRQGFSVGIPARFILEQNSRFSSFLINPEIRYSANRFFDPSNSSQPVSTTSHLISANIFASLNYKLQQNIRDFQPNSGLILFSELEHQLKTDNFTINTSGTANRFQFQKPTALRSGLFGYISPSPLRSLNHSLRIGLQFLTQSNPVFDTQDVVSDGFLEPVFENNRNLGSISTRYTIPLVYPDNGGFLVPLYLSNVYFVLFTNTVANLDSRISINQSRTVIGGGIRARFRISNLALDIGIGVGFEPTRNKTDLFFGDF